jgi:diacylglycerol kinase (ATP)
MVVGSSYRRRDRPPGQFNSLRGRPVPNLDTIQLSSTRAFALLADRGFGHQAGQVEEKRCYRPAAGEEAEVETAVRQGGKELLESVCDLERVAMIFNPASGVQDAETRRATLEQLARDAGLSCELGITDVDRGAAPLAEQAVADGMERLLVSGGDGSLTEAANALVGTETALAVLPGGTGNLLALNLGLPTDPEDAVRLALTGEARPMDVARANGVVFLLMAGMGLDAHMVHDADRESKDRLGVLAYFLAAYRNFGRRPVRYAITIDGRRFHRRAKTVLVANMGKITGGLELAPGADPEDGLLDVVILRAQGVRDIALLAAKALVGRHIDDPLLEFQRGRDVVIETGAPQPVQIDGNELEPTTRLHIRVEPGALRVVRAPTVESNVPLVARPVVALARNVSIAWGLLAGAATASALHARSRLMDHRRRPDVFTRHPLLSGLAAGALVRYLQRRREEAEGDDLIT